MDALLPVAILVAVLARLLRQRLAVIRMSPPSGPRVAMPAPSAPPRATVPVMLPDEPPAVRPAVRPAARPARVDAAPPVPITAPYARARASRRLDVRRDLIAAELLAPPVALRPGATSLGGGAAWR